MRVCVYCASSPKIDAAYFEATRRLAIAFVENGVEVVFGGGATGLMGQLADTVLEKGGKIKGIMPQFMNEVEWAHRGVSDFEFTKSMHERKARFLEGIDAVVALPGGTGTFEELLEAITLKRLGQFTKPIIIVNTNDYYAPLRQMLEKAVAQNFMHKKHLRMWTFVDEAEEVLPAIKHTGEWGEGALNIARNT
jgi:uncharacterized protein (TIGR00730 family)